MHLLLPLRMERDSISFLKLGFRHLDYQLTFRGVCISLSQTAKALLAEYEKN